FHVTGVQTCALPICVPDPLTDIGQVHGVDPVVHAPGASHVLTLDPGGGLPLLLLPGLIQGPDAQELAVSGLPGGRIQPRDRVPAEVGHHLIGVPDRTVEQPLGLVRGAVPDPLGDRPPVAFGQVRRHRADVLTGLHPRLDPGEAAPDPVHQLVQARHGPLSLYDELSGCSGSCSRHTDLITEQPSSCPAFRSQDHINRPGSPASLGPAYPPTSGREVLLPYWARCGCMTCGTPASRCSWTSAFRRTSSERSSDTATSR